MVPFARVGQGVQHGRHVPHVGDAPVEFPHMRERDGLHVGAGALAVAPEAEQVADAVDGKAEVPGASNECEAMHVGGVEMPVVAGLPARRGNQPDRLIVPDHLDRDTRPTRGLADLHGFEMISRHALTLPRWEIP